MKKIPKPHKDSWQTFYFAPEFWLVTVVILGIAVFLKKSSYTAGPLHNEVAFQAYGYGGTALILLLSGVLLERRDRLVERGFEPLGYRMQVQFEKFGGLELVLFIANLTLLFAALYGHMWTPKNDYHSLYTGLDYAKTHVLLWALPAINLFAIACAVFGRFFGRRTFLLLAALLGIGYAGLFLYFVATYTNTADNSPDPTEPAFALFVAALIASVIAPVIALYIGFRRPPAKQAKVEGPHEL